MRRRLGHMICLLCTLSCGMQAQAAGSAALPDPLGYVSDYGAVLNPDWKARIRSVCQDLERKQAIEMVVVTVPDLGGFASALDYAQRLYQRWGIGSTQQDRGILVLAAREPRQVAVQVGSSLHEIIPSQMRGTLSEDELKPLLGQARYGEGLYRLTVRLASASQERPASGRRHMKGLGIFLTTLTAGGALAFLWWISRPDLRHPYRRIRRGEYWGTGQGGYGGNFGGFGGGTSGEGLR